MPLVLHPKGADLSAVKAAVIEAALPFKVRPFWFTPGEHQKCIVIGEVGDLPILTEYVRPKSQAATAKAVRWFFGLEELPVVHTATSRLEGIFGEGVEEVFDGGPFENSPVLNDHGGWTWPN